MALLGLEIPDEDHARSLLTMWKRVPDLSDEDCETVIRTWSRARQRGFVVFGEIQTIDPQPAETATGQYP